MPVDFLTDEQAAAYARFVGAPSQAELERFFLARDEDWCRIRKCVGLAGPPSAMTARSSSRMTYTVASRRSAPWVSSVRNVTHHRPS